MLLGHAASGSPRGLVVEELSFLRMAGEDGWCGAPRVSRHGWGGLLYTAGTPLLSLAGASHPWWLGHLGFPACPFKALEPR